MKNIAGTILSCEGLGDQPQLGANTVILALRAQTLEFWGVTDGGRHERIEIPRRSILEVGIAGGELVTSGGGFVGGGFGLEGAAIGIAAATIANALTSKTEQTPVVLSIMSCEGLIALSTLKISALALRGLMAPAFADAFGNCNRLGREDPTESLAALS